MALLYTILTAMFGPARRVTAFGKVVHPDRTTLGGEPFTPEAPDFGVAVVELENGMVVRLTANFYVSRLTKQSGIELHGDTGSIHLADWQLFDAAVELARFGQAYEPVPVKDPYPGTDWGRALGDLSDAIGSGRPHRATGAHAAHIVEILDATTTSVAEGRSVEITSSFARPELGSNGSGPA
jgi:predicted dehydrogenase